MARRDGASFTGDPPAAVQDRVLRDRRELAIVAVERTRMPMIVTDPRQDDNPIVLANSAFLELTGYSAHEVLGRNCRFLQGSDTAEADITAIRRGLAHHEEHISIELLNYRKDGSTFWNQLSISAVHNTEGELIYYFASQKDVTGRRETQKLEAAERRLLMEVDHRAMNALALVQSIVSLTRAETIERFASSIKGRVNALARAHRILARSSWSAADLEELITAEVEDAPVTRAGPPVSLPPISVQPVCLALHELVSNAREHGALSSPGGNVALIWQTTPTELILDWTESGVPLENGKHGDGIGLELIRATVEKQLGGKFAEDWTPGGFRSRMTIPWKH